MHADTARVRTDNFELDGSVGCGPEPTDAAKTNRDPRKDPQPGDVLAIGNDVREVWKRVNGQIEYIFPRKDASRWLSLIQWQAWARNAEVRKVAS
jgi:hypothetical protein